jgi:hypothetical protein
VEVGRERILSTPDEPHAAPAGVRTYFGPVSPPLFA